MPSRLGHSRGRPSGVADLQAARADVQEATGSDKPPGAQLHVLTIGVSDLGNKAIYLTPLKFAHRDAQDVANALITTQKGVYMPTSSHSF